LIGVEKSGYADAMRLLVLIVLLALSAAAFADERERFYGTWGTAKQCAREPIKPGGTVLAEPFEISADWLRQGQFGCSLRWGPMDRRENGFFTGANAQCGEDAARAYFLGMRLSGDELTLRWDFPVSNGPLRRCQASTPE
jgi:hypothetical protein